MTREALLGAAGAVLAGFLYLWGPELSIRIHWPIQVLLYEVFFFPAGVMVPSINLGTLWPLYVYAAVLWPVVASVALLLRGIVRPRNWWTSGLLWVTPLAIVTVLAAVVSGSSSFVPWLLIWFCGWSTCVMIVARIAAPKGDLHGSHP